MEIMEDGNLVDRVRILLQRDMQYYQEMQTVLKEPLCFRVSGGRLDFPRHASFAAIKIVTWWEGDFQAAFKHPSGLSAMENSSEGASMEHSTAVIKKIQPSEFVLLVVDTADQLLEHLHTLIQECLDHADLTVLTATLGAAALIRNCLWCYQQHAKTSISAQSGEKINKSYKSYQEMAEAVAERLLDLHCRLISLYILNEADSLSWQSNKPFFERERCSFVIQMWWLYMQGTKTDLWNTVSPKMAQRVYSGMLNESLSIIAARFIHGRPSLARSEQFWTDAFNVLCCTGYLLLASCDNSDEMIGVSSSKLPVAIRDIHAKCNELLVALMLRGTSLRELYQVFRKGFENLEILKSRQGPAPWLLVCAPNLLGSVECDVNIVGDLSENRRVILELNILRHQPQPSWPQLIKVIYMNNCIVSKILLKSLIQLCSNYMSEDSFENATATGVRKLIKTGEDNQNYCKGFLCNGETCNLSLKVQPVTGLYSLIYILAVTSNQSDCIIVSALKQNARWSDYLDRRQVWNQIRPPWLNAILKPVKSMMQPIIETLLDAVKTGASVYQAMSLVIGCFTELYTTLPIAILRTTLALNENIPAHCHPVGNNVLLQVLCASLYTSLFEFSRTCPATLENSRTYESNLYETQDTSAIAIALAEAVCSIDEDNKHTAQIDNFFQLVKEHIEKIDKHPRNKELENMNCIIETYADELLFTDFGRRSLKVAHELVVCISDLLLDNLRNNTQRMFTHIPENSSVTAPLTHTMFHIEDTTFDQFLTKYESTNWKRVLMIPHSIPMDRVRSQILVRPEFKNIGELSEEDREALNRIKQLCSAVKSTRFK